MKNIPVNPTEILAYKIDRQDAKRIVANYTKWLGMYLMVLILYIIIMSIDTNKDFITLPKLLLFMVTLLFAGCFIYYGRIIYKSRTNYRRDIEKYGAQVLTNDLMKPENEVFYLNSKKSETYVIISDAFLYFSHTRIFSWDEISRVYINPGDTPLVNNLDIDFSSSGIEKPYNPNSKNPKETVRFIKHSVIELKNGKKEKSSVALEEDQLKMLFNVLNEKFLKRKA